MEYFILIVAAGKGQRFGGTPKQFVELLGMPLLMHTFRAFGFLSGKADFVLVLPEDYVEHWKALCRQHGFDMPHRLITGGPERFHSVTRGLSMVPDDVLVAIHDGVRPLVSEETVRRCFDVALRKGNAIPAVPFRETVRETDGVLNRPADRERLRIIQTPQVFHSTLIKKAYRRHYSEKFTDDALVLESAGHPVYLAEGNPENIKITTPADLIVAEALLKQRG